MFCILGWTKSHLTKKVKWLSTLQNHVISVVKFFTPSLAQAISVVDTKESCMNASVNLTTQVARHLNFIADFNFSFVHCSGKIHTQMQSR